MRDLIKKILKESDWGWADDTPGTIKFWNLEVGHEYTFLADYNQYFKENPEDTEPTGWLKAFDGEKFIVKSITNLLNREEVDTIGYGDKDRDYGVTIKWVDGAQQVYSSRTNFFRWSEFK